MTKEHCFICGTSHSRKEWCPPDAFAVVKCECGKEFLLPIDVLFCGIGFCGDCGRDDRWSSSRATLDDMKRLWLDYGETKQ